MKHFSKGALFALLFVLSTLMFKPLLAQEKTIYMREFYDDKTLELILFDLSMNYNLDFVVDRDKIKGLDLETAMKAYLKGTDLDFHIENDRKVHIYPHIKKEEGEYVYLYNSLNQDTRELNEPFSNVENGLGIFTAFNSDTLYLEVVPVY